VCVRCSCGKRCGRKVMKVSRSACGRGSGSGRGVMWVGISCAKIGNRKECRSRVIGIRFTRNRVVIVTIWVANNRARVALATPMALAPMTLGCHMMTLATPVTLYTPLYRTHIAIVVTDKGT